MSFEIMLRDTKTGRLVVVRLPDRKIYLQGTDIDLAPFEADLAERYLVGKDTSTRGAELLGRAVRQAADAIRREQS